MYINTKEKEKLIFKSIQKDRREIKKNERGKKRGKGREKE